MRYEDIRDKVKVAVIPVKDPDALKKVPHDIIKDIAVIYQIQLLDYGQTGVLTAVTNEALNKMGVSKEQLRRDALINSVRENPVVFQRLSEILSDADNEVLSALVSLDESGMNNTMYLASIPSGKFGACVLAYPGFFEQAADIIGGDYFIFPSSPHIVLLLADTGDLDAIGLKFMNQKSAAATLNPKNVLSDDLFRYDAKLHKLETADEYCARRIVDQMRY